MFVFLLPAYAYVCVCGCTNLVGVLVREGTKCKELRGQLNVRMEHMITPPILNRHFVATAALDDGVC